MPLAFLWEKVEFALALLNDSTFSTLQPSKPFQPTQPFLKNGAKIDFFKQDARCQMLDIRQFLLESIELLVEITLANQQISTLAHQL